MSVSLVIVSHSTKLAEGVAELAGQMAQGKCAIVAAGGTLDGTLGTSMEKILTALQAADGPDGILVLLNLGSAVMATEMAVEMFLLDHVSERVSHVLISPAPLVEGAVIAAVEASIGNSLQEVAEAAAIAHTIPKLHSTSDI